MVLDGFERSYNSKNEEAELYLLDLIRYRELSSAVEERFGVIHESPQVLVIKDRRVLAHASHGSILDLDYKDVQK